MVQLRFVLGLSLALILAGCTGPVVGPEGLELINYAGPPSGRGPVGNYILGPGDRVRIKVYEDANITGEYEVNSRGFVSVPLVGQVKAAGNTTQGLEQTLVSRMKGTISQDPKVNVEIATYAPFYIFGEVKKAGTYPFQPGMTLADAVAIGGGFTYRANEDAVILERAGARFVYAVPVLGRVRIYPGDNIRVAERFF